HTRSDRDWSSDVCSSDLEDSVARRSPPLALYGILGNCYCTLIAPRFSRDQSIQARLSLLIRVNSIFATSSVKTIPRVGARPSTKIGRASCRERVCVVVVD